MSRILTLPDDLTTLTQVSDSVERGEDWEEVVRELYDTLFLKENKAAGLAAIQLGIPKRIFVASIKGNWVPFVNPVVKRTWGSYHVQEEGCLSIPDATFKVARWENVEILPFQVPGHPTPQSWFLHDWEARVIQHEMDHLDGIPINKRRRTES